MTVSSAARGPETVIRGMRAGDAGAAMRLWYASWLDTYVRPGGMTAEAVQERWRERLTAEGIARLAHTVGTVGLREDISYLVAEREGAVVGLAYAMRPQPGTQRLSALYVSAESRGCGVGSALVEALDRWFDPSRPTELEVASFNEGAIRFYRRHGFELVPGSEQVFDGVLPEVSMVRPACAGPGAGA